MRAARGGARGLQASLDDRARYRLVGKLAHRTAPLQVGFEFGDACPHDVRRAMLRRTGERIEVQSLGGSGLVPH